MPLSILPDLVFPITKKQFDPLYENVVQLNTIDAGIPENQQRALGIYFHTWDLWVKSKGRIDYRGKHAELLQDAMHYCGTGNPTATRHSDLAAAHLSMDYSDCQIRLKDIGHKPLASDPHKLLEACRDVYEWTVLDEKRVGLLLDVLGKKPLR